MCPLRIVALLSLAILLVAVPAVTQVTISIPNSFMAGDVLLPPGDYTISTTNPVILAISGPQGTVFVHARAVQKNTSSAATNRVTFTHTSENYTLHQVWIEGSNTGYDLVHNEMDNDI